MSGPFRRLRGVPFRLWDMLRLAPAARAVAWACLAGFLIQTVAGRVDVAEGVSFGEALQLGFGLHLPLLLSGFVWQVVTYMFLHGGWLHLLVNLLTLLLFGAGLEIEIGSRRFLRVFLLGGALGGADWAAADLAGAWLAAEALAGHGWLQRVAEAAAGRGCAPHGHGVCIGASGGIFALIGAFGALFPRRRVVVFPLMWTSFPARPLAVALGAATVVFAAWQLGSVAYLTHLFGGAAGYAYGRRLARDGWGEEEA